MKGIYIIENIKNNKMYIGLTKKCFMERFETHILKLNCNQHANKHLQASWNKYGEENFIFDILEIVEEEELITDREIYWINYYQSYDRDYGYNKTYGGESVVLTPEIRKKQSESLKEHWKNNKHPWEGRNHSEESRLKMSESAKRKDMSRFIGHKYSLGSKNHTSILDEDKVREIKILLNQGKMPMEIAVIYNVDRHLIYKIRSNKTWKHVTV